MFAIISHWLALARTTHDRRQAIQNLSRLSDAQLVDLGFERGTLEEQVRDGLPMQPFEATWVGLQQPTLQGCG